MRRRQRCSVWLRAAMTVAWCVACAGRGLNVDPPAPPAVLTGLGGAMVPELKRAWIMAHSGASAAEEAVVVTKTPDGGYQAAVQPHSNLHGSARFVLPPEAVAVFHTHSDRVLPQPSKGDRELADRMGVPVLTLSRQGLFLYDPEGRTTWKLMERLNWLRVEAWERIDRAAPARAR